ncbi:MAG: tandem-95 repeat protein [Calditrichaeota bacterium]|nr:tandem-95 repeat protein [Calditrichota bacterium]
MNKLLRHTITLAFFVGLMGAQIVWAEESDPLTAQDLAVTTDEDTRVTFSVPDGAITTGSGRRHGEAHGGLIRSITQPSHGRAYKHGNGTITYNPSRNYNGSDEFTYTITDDGQTTTGTVSVTVNPVNDRPRARFDRAWVSQGDSVIIPVLANDYDVDGDMLTVEDVQSETGVVNILPDGSVSYTPPANFTGRDFFRYTVSDGQGGTDVALVAVRVSGSPLGDNPMAQDDEVDTLEDTPVTIDVLANDTTGTVGRGRRGWRRGRRGQRGDNALTLESITQPSNGTATMNGDSSVTYIPDADYNGTDEFTYTVSNSQGQTAIGTITVAVIPVNDDPVAADLAIETNEDMAVSDRLSAQDVDGDDLTYSLVSDGTNGTLVVTDTSTGAFTYTPYPNETGADTLTYHASDGELESNLATIYVTIHPVNDAPAAEDQTVATLEDQGVPITLSATDVDGDNLTYQVITDPVNGVLSGSAPALTYTPNANFSGDDGFTFQVSDGTLTDVGTVTISVRATNDPPVAVDDAYNVDEDNTLAIDALSGVLANDSDPDGDPLTAEPVSSPSNGSLTLNADGAFTYTPQADFNGTDSFTYAVSDGIASDQATVTVTVNPVNDDPVALDDEATVGQRQSVSIAILDNDTDVDGDALTVKNVRQAKGVVHINSDSTLITVEYTSTPNFVGLDEFFYTIEDGHGGQASATVRVTVLDVNDPPVITSPATAQATEDQPFTYVATATDPEGQPITFAFSNLSAWLEVDASGNSVSGTPTEGVTSGSLTITASDGELTAVLDVTVTVGQVNDPPVAVDDAYSVNEDTDLVIGAPGVLDNDSDIEDDPLTAVLVAGPSNGSLTLNTDGSFTYTPDAGYNGTDTFTYKVSDGKLESSPATVTITVDEVNDAPVAVDDEASTDENSLVIINVLENDVDADVGDVLSVASVTQGANGSVVINPDGTVTYTPNENFSGSDSFTYTVSDNNGGSATATVTVLVNLAGDLAADVPVDPAEGDTLTTDIGVSIEIPAGSLSEAVNIQIGTYNEVPPGAPELAGILYFFGPSGTTFDPPATITVPYDPLRLPDGFDPMDLVLLIYSEIDGTWAEALNNVVDTDAQTVSGQTYHFSGFAAGLPLNKAPHSIGLPPVSINEDAQSTVIVENLDDYFVDPNFGDQIEFDADTLDEGLHELVITQVLSLRAEPILNFFGEVRIVVTATDSAGLSGSDTLFLTVTSVNDPPEFTHYLPDLVIPEDVAAQISLADIIAAVIDVDDDPLSFSAASDTSAVTAAMGDTALALTPAANWNGSAQIVVSALDGQAAAQDTFTLTVVPAPDPPSAFALLTPDPNATIQVETSQLDDSLAFTWKESVDPDDGDQVRYTFVLSDTGTVYFEYDTTVTEVRVSYADIAAVISGLGLTSATFQWNIIAIAGQDTVMASNGPYNLTIDTSTLAVVDQNHLPQFFALHQNYPNPFNPVTTLRYELPAHCQVILIIYDMRGREVVRLVDGYVSAGYNKVVWNSGDASGRPVPSGIYFARLITPEYTHVIKMSLIR